jgi:2,4-dienoyl-CoA reductase-like NADH-dependent reductase (Old Yellow Enzyme family)
MAHLNLEPLFTPFAIKGVTLPNRFVMPGMQRQWCDNGVRSRGWLNITGSG